MIIVADSGSTKTAWRACKGGAIVWACETYGLNPHTANDEQIRHILQSLPADGNDSAKQVFFYGAGCGSEAARQRITMALQQCFPAAVIAVHTDLIGACRATVGDGSGLVGILGTGSNVCHYLGGEIAYRPASLGYVLGDEGSGVLIGKRLLCDYLRHRMPADVAARFEARFPQIGECYVSNIYDNSDSVRYMGSLASFAIDCQDNQYIEQLLLRAFREYLQGPVEDTVRHQGIANRVLNMVGGAAMVFEQTLRKAAAIERFEIAQIIGAPIDALVKYHTQQ